MTTFVEVGPGQRPLRSRQADRPGRQGDFRQQPREPGEGRGVARSCGRVLLARGQDGARHRCVARDRQGDRARAGARRARRSWSGTDRVRKRPKSVAAEIGGRAVQADVSDPEAARALVEEAGELDILVNNAGLTRDGVLARMCDEDWRTVIDTNLSSVFYTCRAASRGMMRQRERVDRERLLDRRRARELGTDELRGLEGGDHRVHEVPREASSVAATCARTSWRPAT